MLAYKTQIHIISDMLFLKIPSNFKGKRVEIIVLETADTDDTDFVENLAEVETIYEIFSITNDEIASQPENQTPNDFQKFLLSSPTWTENDYQNFIETRKLFNQWKIQ